MTSEIQPISAWLPVDDLAPWVIAGPCSAESKQQVLSIARQVAEVPRVRVFRAGLWKPRTRPSSFQGVGEAGLGWLQAVKEETSLKTTTEVACARHVELCLESGVDVLWVGARTTVNPFLVQEIAEALRGCDLPVMVKNPVSSELGLWLGAIERLYQAGIRKIVAIHRGFSVYHETQYRNQPNWQIPIELKRRLPKLPLVCDPSHIAGDRKLVGQVAQMALDLGINGLMIETHCDPDRALSDAKQQITPASLATLLRTLRVRKAGIGDQPPDADIARIRSLIDEVDRRIILDLAERLSLVEDIGRIKRQHDIPVLQIHRWEDLLEDHLARAREMGLDSQFIKAVFELIHAKAVELQL